MNRGSVQREGALPSWRTITVLKARVLYYLPRTPLGYCLRRLEMEHRPPVMGEVDRRRRECQPPVMGKRIAPTGG